MPIVGLDLGNHNFRAVQLEKKRDTILLTKFGEYENPKINFNSENKDDVEAYTEALKDFFTEMGFDTPEVIVSLNDSQVYMRIIKLPKMSDKDLKDSIGYEAEQYIPLPKEEINISYQKLDLDFQDKAKMNVQIVAAREEVLNKYIEIVKKARLVPRALEPETLALGRVLGDTPQAPMGTMVVDMGFSRTLISIVYAGAVRFTRNVLIGGNTITRAVQQGLKLDYPQAEEYKRTYGIDPAQVDGKVYTAIKPAVDNIITEIKRAALFFTKQTPNANMKRVILNGGTAQMPGLLPYVASKVDLEVEIADPLRNISVSPKLEKMQAVLADKRAAFSVAIGLALKEV
jgi:type IV pilus assembly protein PilM